MFDFNFIIIYIVSLKFKKACKMQIEIKFHKFKTIQCLDK